MRDPIDRSPSASGATASTLLEAFNREVLPAVVALVRKWNAQKSFIGEVTHDFGTLPAADGTTTTFDIALDTVETDSVVNVSPLGAPLPSGVGIAWSRPTLATEGSITVALYNLGAAPAVVGEVALSVLVSK